MAQGAGSGWLTDRGLTRSVGGSAVGSPESGAAASVTAHQVGVDNADGLHQRIHRRRSDEGEPLALQRLGEGFGLGGASRDLTDRRRLRGALGSKSPDVCREVAVGVLARAAFPVAALSFLAAFTVYMTVRIHAFAGAAHQTHGAGPR